MPYNQELCLLLSLGEAPIVPKSFLRLVGPHGMTDFAMGLKGLIPFTNKERYFNNGFQMDRELH